MYKIYGIIYRDCLTLKIYKTHARASSLENARDIMESEVHGNYEIMAIYPI
jgi:hypothetical protein